MDSGSLLYTTGKIHCLALEWASGQGLVLPLEFRCLAFTVASCGHIVTTSVMVKRGLMFRIFANQKRIPEYSRVLSQRIETWEGRLPLNLLSSYPGSKDEIFLMVVNVGYQEDKVVIMG